MGQIDLEIRKELGINVAKNQFQFMLIPMLKKAYEQGITEFRLVTRCGSNGEAANFYIHPMGKDGETIDVSWEPIDAYCEDFEPNK